MRRRDPLATPLPVAGPTMPRPGRPSARIGLLTAPARQPAPVFFVCCRQPAPDASAALLAH